MKKCYALRLLAGTLCAVFLPLMPSVAAPDDGQAIRLRNAVIDTSAFARQARAGALGAQDKISAEARNAFGQAADSTVSRPFIIQFAGPVLQEWKRAVEQTGARLGGYLPDNAFIAEMNPDQLGRAAALDCVQWVGPFKPEYKTDPELGRRFAAALRAGSAESGQSDVFTIQTFSAGHASAVRAAVINRGGKVVAVAFAGRRALVRAEMAAAAAAELVRLPEVEFVEVYVAPQPCNDVATDGEHMNVQVIWTNHNLTGAGQIVAVADTGLDTGNINTIHPDFSNRVVAAIALGRPDDWSDSTANNKGGHGTHVAGSVLGSGAAWSNGLFRGCAYGASLVFQSVMDANGLLGGIPDALTNLFYQAYTNGARLHNNSWGSSVAGRYDSSSQSADQFVWDIGDMLLLVAAGNEGTDAGGRGVIDPTSINSPATAKNVLTVGASESKRPSGSGGYSAYAYYEAWPNDYPANPIRSDLISTAYDTWQGMAAFSSRGPCIDGRFKPDIVAPGTDIVSCRARMPGAGLGWGTGSGVLGNAASNYYIFNGGTSMATPLTTGAAALMRQYLQERCGFALPSAALMKAILVNGARSLSPGQYGTGQYREIPSERPNNVEGWGQVDLGYTLFPAAGVSNVYYDVSSPADALVTGASVNYSFAVSAAGTVSVTLCWSDYPAALPAARQLVNDLDLAVVTPDGVTHYPNGGSGADRLNNTEGVQVYCAGAGTIQVTVSGYNVPNGPQPYALVIRGPGAALPPTPASHAIGAVSADFDGDGKADPAACYASGTWQVKLSSAGYTSVPLAGFLGGSGLSAMAADFDGDRLADPAVYEIATGTWQIKLSTAGYAVVPLANYLGGHGWAALAGDFDGDGKADPAVYQAVGGNWKARLSSAGYAEVPLPEFLGASGWSAVAADFDGDRLADPAVYESASGSWQVKLSGAGYASVPLAGFLGGSSFSALAADFDGDGKADPAVVQVSAGHWQIKLSSGNYALVDLQNFLGE